MLVNLVNNVFEYILIYIDISVHGVVLFIILPLFIFFDSQFSFTLVTLFSIKVFA